MYFDHYAFSEEFYIKTGGMSPQQVLQDDQSFKAMIVAGTNSKMQIHCAFTLRHGVHVYMQLLRDFGHDGRTDADEYAMTILRDLQVKFNPHKADSMNYVLRFDKLMRRHQEITGNHDLFYLTLFGAFCVESMNIPDHDWQTLKQECLQGGSIYDTLLQVARRVPPGL